MDSKELRAAAKLGLSGLSTSNALPFARSGIPPLFVVIRAHPFASASKTALDAGSCQTEGTIAIAAFSSSLLILNGIHKNEADYSYEKLFKKYNVHVNYFQTILKW